MSKDDLNFLFLGGHRKCGTTMLLNLLDGHPELCVYPTDITMLYAYFPTYEEGDFSPSEKKDRLDAVIFDTLRGESIISEHMDIDALRSTFWERMESSSYGTKDSLKELLIACSENLGLSPKILKSAVVKESSIEIYAKYIFQWFPNAKFVHLIRDPRDTFAAVKAGLAERYSHFGDDAHTILHSLLERCHLGMRMAEINQRRYGDRNYKVLRFEDLVTNPVDSLMELCDFVGIDYHDSLTIPTVLGRPTRGNNFEKMDFSTISAKNVGGWTRRIQQEEAQIIEFHFASLMRSFNYPIQFSEIDQVDSASEFYKWSNRKYHYVDHIGVPQI